MSCPGVVTTSTDNSHVYDPTESPRLSDDGSSYKRDGSMQGLWWLPALLGFLIIAGGFLPFFSGSRGHVASDASGTGMVLGLGAVAFLAALDTARGDDAGLSAAAGLGALMAATVGAVLVVVFPLSKALTRLTHGAGTGIQLGAGGWCWVGAAICGVALIVPGLRAVVGTRGKGQVHPAIAAGIGLAGTLLIVGLCIPPTPGSSIHDHLFGSSNILFNAAIVALLVVTAGAVALAALVRTTGAVTLALGAGGYWFVDWALGSAGFRASGASFVTLLNGSFAVVTTGLFALVGLCALGLFLPRGTGTFVGADQPGPDRSLVPILPVLIGTAGLVLLPVGVARHGSTASPFAAGSASRFSTGQSAASGAPNVYGSSGAPNVYGSGASNTGGYSSPGNSSGAGNPSAGGPSGSSIGGSTSDSASSSGGGLGGAGSNPSPPALQASRLQDILVQLLNQSGQARTALRTAVAGVNGCTTDANAAAATADSAAETRQSILGQLSGFDSSAIPNGAQVISELQTAMTASVDADHSYASWMRWVAATGCLGNARHNGDYDAAGGASTQATAAKEAFVALWNPVAATYGYPQLTELQL